MNRLLTQLNAQLNIHHLISPVIKFTLTLLFFFALIPDNNNLLAQSNDCPEGEPLEWYWIREFLEYKFNRCRVGEISQFEYNGNIYIETKAPETVDGKVCPLDYGTRYFDCQGNYICDLLETYPDECDLEMLAAAKSRTTLWTYNECGGDPFAWAWIQDLIASSDGNTVAAIHQFEYDYNYYYKTINLDTNAGSYYTYFNCEGEQICEYVVGSDFNQCDETYTYNTNIHWASNRYNIIWSYEDPYPAGTCPEVDDPLQWAWIQDLTALGNPCKAGIINQFEYNENTYFHVFDGQYCGVADYNQYFYNCAGDTVCHAGWTTSCGLEFLQEAWRNGTTIWAYEPPMAKTCPEGYVENWDWVQEIKNNINCSGEIEIVEIRVLEFTIFHFWNECDNEKNTFYDCQGNLLCEGASDIYINRLCNDLRNYMQNYTPSFCPEGDNPLEWDWVRDLIIEYSDCEVREIRQFEFRGKTYFKTISGLSYPCGEFGLGYFDCSGRYICDDLFGQNCPQDMVAAANTYEHIWHHSEGIPFITCPEGDPLQWDWLQEKIADSGCTIKEIRQFEYNGSTHIVVLDNKQCMQDGGLVYYDCSGKSVCSYSLFFDTCTEAFESATNSATTIYTNPFDAIIYPENSYTICAPVSLPPLLTVADFSTTGEQDFLSTLTIEFVEEQIDVQDYFTSTLRLYLLSSSSGNYTYFSTTHHIANQFLRMPEVSQPGIICEEDLWSYIKIGTGQYKIYADDNGSKGTMMSTCNTPSLICSTANLSVDTKVAGEYHFWASQYFEFPDGTVCESEAMPFYVDVQAKPTATLNTQNKTMTIGEGLSLMDEVAVNKSGYWTGENIIYLLTATGEIVAYFSANEAGAYKLYYTVSNEFCEQSYLLLVEVNNNNRLGCTNEEAYNYNPAATVDDGSCINRGFNAYNHPWLSSLINSFDCSEQIEFNEYHLRDDTYIYIENESGGILYVEDGTIYCSDEDGETCLENNSILLGNPTYTWVCFENALQKFNWVYTICEGESISLTANRDRIEIPCICEECIPIPNGGPTLPPEVIWSLPPQPPPPPLPGSEPEPVTLTCNNAHCGRVTVSPNTTTHYSAKTPADLYSRYARCDDGPPGTGLPGVGGPTVTGAPSDGPWPSDAILTYSDFLVIVEQCPLAKPTINNQTQKKLDISINIYPNPTSHKIFIDLPDDAIYQVSLTDISGKVMKQIETKLDATIVELNVSDFPKGMYLIEMKNGQSRSVKKLIVE